MTRHHSEANFKPTFLTRISMKKIIINIGRQYGSGGKQVAMEIGRKLGIDVYDHEILLKSAEKSGFSQDFFEKKDEKKSFFNLSTVFSSQTFGNSQNYIEDDALFRIQSSVITDIASRGSAVIVGRCADYILRDCDFTLDVFVTAPEKIRCERVSERMNITLEKAAEKILKEDKERENYYNYFTFGHWGVASNYDLCVDSSILGIEGTADYIIDFARRGGLIK